MGSDFICPFCGQRGDKTKEHVWARWLHNTQAATTLLAGTHGERVPRRVDEIRQAQDHRYEVYEATDGSFAKWLPHLTVSVCAECNGGWMSRLENRVKAILGPFVFNGSTLRLSAEDLRALTTWATKSWMAYALTRPAQQNPFTRAEYRGMAASPGPLSRSRVWLLHSLEPRAHVGMGVASGLFSSWPVPDLEKSPDNTAYGYLAAASVVMIMLIVPSNMPMNLVELLGPPAVSSAAVRRVWPDPRAQYFPLGLLPDTALAATLAFPRQVFEAIGLPTVGLSQSDAERAYQDFIEGADPAELTRRWTGEAHDSEAPDRI